MISTRRYSRFVLLALGAHSRKLPVRATSSNTRSMTRNGAFVSISLAALTLLMVALLAACRPSEPETAEEIRPVRSTTVQHGGEGEIVSVTGRLQAQEEVSLAFRIGGRMIERPVAVGDRVEAGQVIAKLDPDDELSALQSARAAVAAASARLTQTRNAYDRQATLLRRGFTTRALYDEATFAWRTAQADADAAQAQAETSENQLRFTELIADSAGVVVARGAEPGEVVGSGQMIVQIARQGGRDAVFDVPASLIRMVPGNPEIEVSLTAEPEIKTIGRVREVAPQADPVTGTFQVRVGLSDPPEPMRLGATLTGRVQLGAAGGFSIPASALTRADRQPAVWIVDPASGRVSLRNVELARHDIATALVTQGLENGDVVVTAGVQALRPDQKVRLLEAP
ncbi:MAG TPA: efflux RND transporter periplasmic adaptor subunit [Inquilinus sp.]